MSFRTAGQSSFLAAAVAFGGVLGVGCSDGDGSNTGGSGGSAGDPITSNGGSGGMAGAGGSTGGVGGNTGGVGGGDTGGVGGGNTGGVGGGNTGGMGGDGGGGTGGPVVEPGDGCDDLSKLEGKWAMLSVQPVTWEPTGVVLEGEGQFEIMSIETVEMLGETEDGGTEFRSSGQVCALNAPAFQGMVEALGIIQNLDPYFHNETFDNSNAPPIVATGVAKDDHLTMGDAPMALGIEFDNPLMDSFPGTFSDAQSVAVDHDQDGKPAITAVPAPEIDPENCPFTDADGVEGDCTTTFSASLAGEGGVQADQLHIAQRTIFNMEGPIESCEGGTGDLTTKSIEISVVSCNIDADSWPSLDEDRPCDNQELQFLNDNTPAYVPDGKGTVTRVKLPDDATCAEARAALQN